MANHLLNLSLMPLRILIAPDKFKGTLTAHDAAEAMERGWKKNRPKDQLELLPMSDGGDGFGEIISQLIGAKPRRIKTVDAAHQPIETIWWWEPKSKTAVIESAKIIGLAMLPRGKFHPFQLDTFGLGKVLQAAAAKGAQRCIIGIGGSATNDGGFGMARALGWKFFCATPSKGESNLRQVLECGSPLPLLDRVDDAKSARGLAHSKTLSRYADASNFLTLQHLTHIEAPKKTKLFKELIVAVDVQNKLLGPLGCSRVFGPQKGLRPEDFPIAECCLKKMALQVVKLMRRDSTKIAGAGAAGGLGFGLMSFLGAKPQAGFEIFARCANLKERLSQTDLVITGEGALDAQSMMGKGTGALAQLCRKLKVPCLALAGTVLAREKSRKLFVQAHGLTDITSAEQALRSPSEFLEILAATAAGRPTL